MGRHFFERGILTFRQCYCEVLRLKNEEYQKTVKSDECAVITEIFSRKAAWPLAAAARRVNISANAVTVAAGLSWMISMPCTVAAGYFYNSSATVSAVLWTISGFLWIAGYILDVADGSLARLQGTASNRGFFLDYVFHLLFKPGFFASLAVALHLQNGGLWWLMLAIASIPANWTSAESASEHVLCEQTGKGKLPETVFSSPELRIKVFLGLTDIKDSASVKRSSVKLLLISMAKEIISYYGQSVFFAFTVFTDVILALSGVSGAMPLTSACTFLIVAILFVRLPFRILREYRRLSLTDM